MPGAEDKRLTASGRLVYPARPMVIATRTGHGWRAEIVDLGVIRRARGLSTVDRQVRAILGPIIPNYQFHTGNRELDLLVAKTRSARLAARTFEDQVRLLTNRVLALPHDQSIRDLGVLLGLSHQRIHQQMHRVGRTT